jgi:sec-independent protein translocase protein TatB
MFGLGTWELILVLGGAVLFIGPDKLPELAKTLGRSMRSVQKAMSGVDETMRPVHNAARKINESIDNAMDLEDEEMDSDGDSDHDGNETPSETTAKSEHDDSAESDGRVAALDPFMPIPEPEEKDDNAQDTSETESPVTTEANELGMKDESPT